MFSSIQVVKKTCIKKFVILVGRLVMYIVITHSPKGILE